MAKRWYDHLRLVRLEKEQIRYDLKDGILYYNFNNFELLVVPEALQDNIIKHIYDMGYLVFKEANSISI